MDYKKFSIEQLFILSRGMDKGLDIRYYLDYNFSVDQMKLIEECLLDGIDVKYIANYRFTLEQMKLIIDGQKEGLDVSLYANPKYNIDKMKTIVACLRNGIDPKFARKGYSIEQINFYGNKLYDKMYSRGIDIFKEQELQKVSAYVKTLEINTQNKNNK